MFKEVSDPLYGFIKLTPPEVKLIDTFPFQRLRHIKQLGLTYLVFPSAHHSRFEHALGVFFVSDLLASLLPEEEKEDRKLLRLAGLLHDLGHPPFSHTTEVLFPEDKDHEDMTRRIILETEIYDLLKKDFGLSHESVESLIRVTLGEPKDDRERFLTSFITGQFGSDRIDYLRRDAYFCGVSYGLFDYQRLISTLRVIENGGKRLLAVDSSGLRALENFLIGRYFMYLQVYFHRVVRILNIHLIEFIREVLVERDFTDLETFLSMNDCTFISLLSSDKRLEKHARRLLGREHFKEVFRTQDKEVFSEAKRLVLEKFPEDLVRFDSVFKKPYDEEIAVLEGDKILPAEEVSPLIGSLRPIEVYRIYAEGSIREEVCSLLKG